MVDFNKKDILDSFKLGRKDMRQEMIKELDNISSMEDLKIYIGIKRLPLIKLENQI